MKNKNIIPLIFLLLAGQLYSQTLKEFVIEKDNSPQVFHANKGCTPNDGVLVFFTSIPDVEFSIPDFPSRLKFQSPFDSKDNCYVLCVQPTDTEAGGIMKYSLKITASGYKPMLAFYVSGINAAVTQYFDIKGEDPIPYPIKAEIAMTRAIDAWDAKQWDDAYNYYKEAADYPTANSVIYKERGAKKFKEKAETIIMNNNGECDAFAKQLLQYAYQLNPTSEIRNLLNKCN